MTARVGPDLLRRALGDLLAVVEDGDPLADAHHHLHVVLDQQDGQLELVAQPLMSRVICARLAGVHAGRRLVQQEQLRLAGQRARQLEPALVAVGQVLGPARPRSAARRPTSSQQLARPLPRRLLLGAHRRQLEQRRPPAAPSCACGARPSRWRDRHGAEQADVLERATDPQLRRSRAASGRRCDAPSNTIVAGRRRQHAGQLVEEGRLAGAVRTDERHDRRRAGS